MLIEITSKEGWMGHSKGTKLSLNETTALGLLDRKVAVEVKETPVEVSDDKKESFEPDEEKDNEKESKESLKTTEKGKENKNEGNSTAGNNSSKNDQKKAVKSGKDKMVRDSKGTTKG